MAVVKHFDWDRDEGSPYRNHKYFGDIDIARFL